MWISEFDKKSYRSILKWGAPDVFKHPEKELMGYIKDVFGLKDSDMAKPHLPGLDIVKLEAPCKLSADKLEALKGIVGAENVSTDDYDRAKHAYGKTYFDAIRMRKNDVTNPPDCVAYPRGEEDVKAVVSFCDRNGIPLVPAGAMSSVTRAIEFPKGGICLDMTRHMKKVLSVNEKDSTAKAQPGIYGPDLEAQLNATKTKSAPGGYTCCHFPQSFEFSTVGGWIAARGAGQQSTGYGKAEDLVISQRWVTPAGLVATPPYPRASVGPDLDQIFLGCEGVFGVMTEATIKIRKFRPENRQYFSFIFKTWDDAVSACREIMQGEFGFPSALRISDPEETSIGLKLHHIEGSPVDSILKMLGYKDMSRCLLLGSTEGDADAGALIKKKAKAIGSKYGGFFLGSKPVKSWWKGRYSDPYMREDLMDIQVMTDTLETSVTWSNLMDVWKGVREVVKARPNTACMVHASHFYENGTNLYFIFLSRMVLGDEYNDYLDYQKKIIDAIKKNGGSLSHHHGVGRMLAPWMPQQSGDTGLEIFRAIKQRLDPNNIMNPGGTLGLD